MAQPFDQSHIDAWKKALETRYPGNPTEDEFFELTQVEAFGASGSNVGVGLRFAKREGGNVDLLMNPVLALEVATRILEFGVVAGWSDEKGNITVPPEAFDA